MNPNLEHRPNLPELKRFLDRLLSSPDGVDTPVKLHQEYYSTAVAMGVVPGNVTTSENLPLPVAELIELTRACIRQQEPVRQADQALETMSAPPAMPEATP